MTCGSGGWPRDRASSQARWAWRRMMITSSAQDWRLPGPSLVTARQRRMTWAARLLDAGEVTEHLLVGGVPVGDQDAGEERQDRGDRRGAPRAHGPQPGQFPAGRADDQHVRRALLRFPGTAGKDVDRGLVSAEYRLVGESGLHRVIEPGGLQLLVQPGAGPVHEPRRDSDAEQHADQPGGTFGRHVPIPAEQHRGPVDPRAIRNGPRVRARRRVRGRQLPAARAQQRRQQPLGHPPGDPHVPDLCPLRARSFRPGQARPAPRALRRRIPRPPAHSDRGPGTGQHRGARAARRACGPCDAPARKRPGFSARPCGVPSPRSAPSSSASPSCCCPSPGGVPVRRAAAPAAVPVPPRTTARPAAP